MKRRMGEGRMGEGEKEEVEKEGEVEKEREKESRGVSREVYTCMRRRSKGCVVD